jgi:hypothetical protein
MLVMVHRYNPDGDVDITSAPNLPLSRMDVVSMLTAFINAINQWHD